MSHFMEVCAHGEVYAQCRCIGPKEHRLISCPHDARHDQIGMTLLTLPDQPYEPKHARDE